MERTDILRKLVHLSNRGNSVILQIDYLPKSEKVVILKHKPDLELFIEILDLNSNSIQEILLIGKMYVVGGSFKNSSFRSENYELHKDPTASVNHFHCIDDDNFYLSVTINRSWDFNLKINSKGDFSYLPTFGKSVTSWSRQHIMKNFIYYDDMTLIDLKDSRERNLIEFVIENFENEEDEDDDFDFTYLYFSEARYTVFIDPDKDILGFEIYNKDGDDPKFSYFVLKIESLENIQILFVGKSYDSGYYYVLSDNSNEIAYKKMRYHEPRNILVRELTTDNFQNADIYKEIDREQIVYLSKEKIVLKSENVLQVLDRCHGDEQTIIIDENSPFEIKNNLLFYVKNARLEIENLEVDEGD